MRLPCLRLLLRLCVHLVVRACWAVDEVRFAARNVVAVNECEREVINVRLVLIHVGLRLRQLRHHAVLSEHALVALHVVVENHRLPLVWPEAALLAR